MTDPLKLAEEIEKWSDLRRDLTTMQLRPESWRLLAAALRLAERASVAEPVVESGDSFMCLWCGVPERRVTFRPHFRHRPDCLLAAYRAAKEAVR